jgi:aqualysin 1
MGILVRRSLAGLLVFACIGGLGVAGQAHAAAADRYIVVLKDSVSDPDAVARDHGNRYGAQVEFTYGHTIKGYAATIPANRVDSVRSDARVKLVEVDEPVSATAQTIPWGITKIGATLSPTALAGNGSGAISNVNVYVIDTGVDVTHPDLNVVGHVNFAGGKNADCNGHGTHVAGTIAARDNTSDVVGVAPGAPITAVKVLGCSGSGYTSGVIAGVDWVTATAVKPAIANMSLGGGASTAMDAAVIASAASGVFYAVAAGNEGTNACNSSPARAGAGTNNGIATVAATDSADKEASFSNYGSCVDIWAPGVSVLSTRLRGGTTTMSGTSMASPHVGGGGALYLSTHTSASAAGVETALRNAAQTTGTLSKNGAAIKREYVATF